MGPARDFLFARGLARRPLGLAVIDATAFQMTFAALERLTRGVRLDLIIIYMSSYIRRFLEDPGFESVLD